MLGEARQHHGHSGTGRAQQWLRKLERCGHTAAHWGRLTNTDQVSFILSRRGRGAENNPVHRETRRAEHSTQGRGKRLEKKHWPCPGAIIAKRSKLQGCARQEGPEIVLEA